MFILIKGAEMTMKCKKCKSPVEKGELFCNICGAKLKKRRLWPLILGIVLLAAAVAACLIVFSGDTPPSDSRGDAPVSTAPSDTPSGTLGEADLSALRVYSQDNAAVTLCLDAETTRLPADHESEISLHVWIPQSVELTTLTIFRDNGETLATFEPAYLDIVEETDIGSYRYFEYRAAITIPAAQDHETAVRLYAVMGDLRSDVLTLYREIPVTDAMLSTLYGVLDDIVRKTDSLEGLPPEALLSETLSYLKEHDKVLDAWKENERVLRFVTVDGLNGAFTLTQVFEDESMNYAGPGVTTDPNVLIKSFTFDKTFRKVAVDPDVLLACPVRNVYNDRDGNGSESVARKLASEYGGTFTLVTDTADAYAPMDMLTSGSLENYGTVMLVSHGSSLRRRDGTSYITPTVYSSKNMDSANAALETFFSRVPDSERTCLMYASGSDTDYSEARLLANVNRTYFDDSNQFILLDTYYDIMATSNYFMDIYSDAWFENTVFYLGACHSYDDVRFNSFLINHGASCVIGYNAPVQVNCEQAICKSIFSDLMNENKTTVTDLSARNYSVQEARDRGYNLIMESLAGYSHLLGGTVDASLYGHLSFVCEGYGRVSGQVSDQAGTPLSGITVTAYRYRNGSLISERTTTTGGDGQYRFDELPWGMYLLQAQNGETECLRQISFAEGDKGNVDFTLDRVTLSVTVVNEDGEFLSSASVICVAEDRSAYSPSLYTDEGTPVFRQVLNPGLYRISITCEGYVGWTGTLTLERGNAEHRYTLKKTEIPEDGIVYNGHFYRVYAVDASWDAAKVFCENLDAHLVTITSAGEQEAVFAYIQAVAPDTDLWIGFSDAADEANWSTWVTGELVTYSNWSPDEPDNLSGQDYGVICNGTRSGSGYYIAPGQWDDISSTDSTNYGYFICEWDYIPRQ